MSDTSKLRVQDIGPWSEVKLEIIKEYASAYSRILTAQTNLKHVYIDAFAGSGVHISRKSGEYVLGSPLNALNVDPPFNEYHLIDLDNSKIDQLKRIIGQRANVSLYHDDCNPILLNEIFPNVRYEQYKRGLCLLDPYGMHLDWEVIQTAGRMRSIDIFLNFPIYDMNINVLRRDPESAGSTHIERMNRYWGDESWREIAYSTAGNLFGWPEKEQNEKVAEGFRKRLEDVAQFEFVPAPMPMKNSKGSVVYYIFFASQNRTGQKIVRQIFEKFGSN